MPLKKEVKKPQSRGKRKTNLLKLCTAMSKLAVDAVDKEVVKRFRTVIDSAEEDLSKNVINQIINHSEDLELSTISEVFHPYIKHYLFMKKRNSKNK